MLLLEDKREITRLLKKGTEILSNLRAEKVVDFVRYKRNKDAMKKLEKKLVSKGNDLA